MPPCEALALYVGEGSPGLSYVWADEALAVPFLEEASVRLIAWLRGCEGITRDTAWRMVRLLGAWSVCLGWRCVSLRSPCALASSFFPPLICPVFSCFVVSRRGCPFDQAHQAIPSSLTCPVTPDTSTSVLTTRQSAAKQPYSLTHKHWATKA